MVRRCLASLLLLAYFAGQLAGTLHAHTHDGQAEAGGNQSVPHCHLGDHADHGHRHSSDQHGHDHEHQAVSPVNQEDGCSVRHDGDATYLSDQIGTPSESSHGLVALDLIQNVSWAVIFDLPSASGNRTGLANSGGSTHLGATPRPLYLTLRALRI